MTEKSILITGCSSGIGYHCAHGLKARGWQVLATARSQEDMDRLRKQGFEVLYLDYTDPAAIAACADRALDLTDHKLYALFNNGAYAQPGAVEDLTPEILRAQFEANFFGWHDLTRRLLPAMRQNGRGRIVNCSSVLGLAALKYRGAYSATKFALEGLTDTLRLELRSGPIHVSAIEPGPIVSRFNETAIRHFHAHIDIASSVHYDAYQQRLKALSVESKSGIFTKGPEAVLVKLIHALEHRRPRSHYHVTNATLLVAWARRVLSRRMFIALSDRIS
ncbi:MAG: SDR family oxidoreductase [Fimbriimonadaceae bacterium]|nr:SDR family oxidoreductase [Alphaproteobacteria bacterium]